MSLDKHVQFAHGSVLFGAKGIMVRVGPEDWNSFGQKTRKSRWLLGCVPGRLCEQRKQYFRVRGARPLVCQHRGTGVLGKFGTFG